MKYLLVFVIVCFACNQSSHAPISTSDSVAAKKDNTEIKLQDTARQKEILKTDTIKNETVSGELLFLKKFEGKYPYEVKMLDHPVLKKRLQKLLGSEYDFLKSIWQVEAPIEINNGMFYAWAMEAHSGGDPGAVIMADINQNVLYVGIRKDKEEKFYSENGGKVPGKMQQWADEQ